MLGRTQPFIIPLFDILKKGKTSKIFDTTKKCKINFNANQMSNFLEINSRGIEHFSGSSNKLTFFIPFFIKNCKLDCEFEPGEEYFILPRTGSSFENFLTYGQINEFETYDLMEIIMQEPLTRNQRDLLIKIEVMHENWEYPFFYLDNRRINTKLRDYFVVNALKKSNMTLDAEFFKKSSYHINDLDIYLQAYIRIYNIFLKEFYFYLFKNILPICRAK